MIRPRADGLSLVELLIVLAIIGLLLQFLLPAVQSSRESARRTECSNHLRQLGTACLVHEAAVGRFPSGGWGVTWIPDPEAGSGPEQPGGWTYSVLPYVEQSNLHDLARGQDEQDRIDGHLQLIATPLDLFYCPTRRRATNYPGFDQGTYHYPKLEDRKHKVVTVAKTDYAANSGDFFTGFWSGAEDELLRYKDIPTDKYTGVIYHSSAVEPQQIVDGLSKTYLLGEKAVPADKYDTHEDNGDSYSLYVGAHWVNCRWTRISPSNEPFPPKPDTALADWRAGRFGSAHAQVCLFVYCDGAVRAVGYGVDPDIHRWAGNRMDSQERYRYSLEGLVYEPIK